MPQESGDSNLGVFARRGMADARGEAVLLREARPGS
jgi:hypothetical protein